MPRLAGHLGPLAAREGGPVTARPRPGVRSKVRGATLAGRKAEAAELEKRMKSHRLNCVKCGGGKGRIRCDEYKGMAADLGEMKSDISNWFAPGEDQAGLF